MGGIVTPYVVGVVEVVVGAGGIVTLVVVGAVEVVESVTLVEQREGVVGAGGFVMPVVVEVVGAVESVTLVEQREGVAGAGGSVMSAVVEVVECVTLVEVVEVVEKRPVTLAKLEGVVEPVTLVEWAAVEEAGAGVLMSVETSKNRKIGLSLCRMSSCQWLSHLQTSWCLWYRHRRRQHLCCHGDHSRR